MGLLSASVLCLVFKIQFTSTEIEIRYQQRIYNLNQTLTQVIKSLVLRTSFTASASGRCRMAKFLNFLGASLKKKKNPQY